MCDCATCVGVKIRIYSPKCKGLTNCHKNEVYGLLFFFEGLVATIKSTKNVKNPHRTLNYTQENCLVRRPD